MPKRIIMSMGMENFNVETEEPAPQEPDVIERPEDREPTQLAERIGEWVPKFFKLETEGLENLDGIPPEKRVIFMATHMSYFDMPLAIAALAEKYPKLKVAEASTHESLSKNPGGYLARQLIGSENSFSVDYDGKGEGDGKAIFNPNNFDQMKGGLEEGNAVVIAAFLEGDYTKKQWRLPARGGNGGVYLAQITPDAVIVPVAVDIHLPIEKQVGDPVGEMLKKRFFGKIRATVRIGKPMDPAAIENPERFKEVMEKRKGGEEVTSEDRADFSRIKDSLREESDRVMAQLNDMLPPEKQAKAA